MKITGKIEVEAVTDVVCDVCQLSTRVQNGGLQFATLRANWGFGSKHDGELYELQLCEDCFFQTVAQIKQNRRTQGLLTLDGGIAIEDFGLIAKDDFFGDAV
jgi:hypothetical protein